MYISIDKQNKSNGKHNELNNWTMESISHDDIYNQKQKISKTTQGAQILDHFINISFVQPLVSSVNLSDFDPIRS